MPKGVSSGRLPDTLDNGTHLTSIPAAESARVAEASLVSVIIPTYQRRDGLRRALASLVDQTVEPDAYEVIVAVDGSTDGTCEMLSGYAAAYRLNVVAGPRRGRAAACNAALASARGEVLVVLDDDMRVVPEFIERHRRHHASGSRLCVLGPVPVELLEDSPRAARYVQAKFAVHLARLAEPDHVYVPRDFYSGNSSLRAEVLRELDGFDESFTAYGNEDVELALRLRTAGVTLRYDGEAVAYQEYSKDLRGLMDDTRERWHDRAAGADASGRFRRPSTRLALRQLPCLARRPRSAAARGAASAKRARRARRGCGAARAGRLLAPAAVLSGSARLRILGRRRRGTPRGRRWW